MGWAKRALEEATDRGRWSTGEAVCAACVTDYALARVVTAAADRHRCDFCGANVDASPFDVLLEAVVSGLRFAYEDPVEQVAYVSSEGGYQVPTFDTSELLQWELEVSDNERVLGALAEQIEGDLWCERDPYRQPEHDQLTSGWQRFRRVVTESRRFTFLTEHPEDDDHDEIPPVHMMPSVIAEAVSAQGLVIELPAGTAWWRARIHDAPEEPRSAGELGAPPRILAGDSRMSPQGISTFYGASTAECAKAEAGSHTGGGKRVSWGKFTTAQPLTVVDLRKPPHIPSVFDEEQREFRYTALFLREFIADAIKPAPPATPIEYYPTQVIAEFLRYQVPASGLIWQSAQVPDVVCCALFVSPDQQADLGSPEESAALIVLDPESVHQAAAPG